MSDEEDSMSDGFSASEDEWKPSKDMRGGESSDDDDSDFEEAPAAGATGNSTAPSGGASKKKRGEPKGRSATKQSAVKKRKPAGQSLRTKLYNMYRPPPKTISSPNSVSRNSPSASTSQTGPKNVRTPNESSARGGENGDRDDRDGGSSSDSSVENYLVNPEELDLQSSFFNVNVASEGAKSGVSPVPDFDCNAGLGNMTDSDSEDNNESSVEEEAKAKAKAFDFRNLLEKANSLERAKAAIAGRASEADPKMGSTDLDPSAKAMDVYSLLALGEKTDRLCDDVKPDGDDGGGQHPRGPLKLSKTKSTRVKRHTKTRPTSTVAAGDTDDSDWEEVADDGQSSGDRTHINAKTCRLDSLEIHVELPSRQQDKGRSKQPQDLELVLRRKLNRNLKERQLQLHKGSLLCCLGRSYCYNRLLNDMTLMQAALKLLPTKNAYPPDRGTEIKYYQSMITWFKGVVKLAGCSLYPEKTASNKARVRGELLKQIERKEARCKQDMVFIFVILLRGMGLQCRLIVNMQPLPLRPAQSDLLPIKLKRSGERDSGEGGVAGKKAKASEQEQDEAQKEHKPERTKTTKQEVKVKVKVSATDKVPKSGGTKKDSEEVEDSGKAKKKGGTSERETNAGSATSNRKEIVEDGRKASSSTRRRERSTEQSEPSNEKGTKEEVKYSTRASKRNLPFQKQSSQQEGSTNPKLTEADVSGSVTSARIEENSKQEAAVKQKQAKDVKHQKDMSRLRGDLSPNESNAQPNCEDQEGSAVNDRQDERTKATTVGLSERPCLVKLKGVGATGAATTKRRKSHSVSEEPHRSAAEKVLVEVGSSVRPEIVIQGGAKQFSNGPAQRQGGERKQTGTNRQRTQRSRSKSPQSLISTAFLQTRAYKEKFLAPDMAEKERQDLKSRATRARSPNEKVRISPDFLKASAQASLPKRLLRSHQKTCEVPEQGLHLQIPQLDGTDDGLEEKPKIKRPHLKKLRKARSAEESDEDFEPSPLKQPKQAPTLPKGAPAPRKDRRVLSTDDEAATDDQERLSRKQAAADMWVEVWSDVEEMWVCVDLFKGKVHSPDSIRKAASSSLAYVFAFQNDLSMKDVTARYCPNWATTVRKSRVEKAWLDEAISAYLGHRTKRDIREDQELRRIHEEKPMPTAIGDYKDHPLYVLERHLLKFQAIYPPNAPTLGFVRGEPVYSRDCVHLLHSREIWLKQARTVKLGEKPYKVVKARPKWDRLTQTVIKDQPLEIFGYWQTQDYEPPTAENGVVPRNAYGNVELFKPSMLPKKTVHLRLPGLNRICKKLGVDCANAVIGFDFHQGACHPTYDGFVVCEEFGDQVTAAWYQDQEEQARKDQEKYEARVYGNWRKLIRGLLIRERLKLKYNF